MRNYSLICCQACGTGSPSGSKWNSLIVCYGQICERRWIFQLELQYWGVQWLSHNGTLQNDDYCITLGLSFLAQTLFLLWKIATELLSKPSFKVEHCCQASWLLLRRSYVVVCWVKIRIVLWEQSHQQNMKSIYIATFWPAVINSPTSKPDSRKELQKATGKAQGLPQAFKVRDWSCKRALRNIYRNVYPEVWSNLVLEPIHKWFSSSSALTSPYKSFTSISFLRIIQF